MIQKTTRVISKLVRALLIRFFQLTDHRQQQQGGLSYCGLSLDRIFIRSSNNQQHGGTAAVPSEDVSALFRQVVQLTRHLFAAAAGDDDEKNAYQDFMARWITELLELLGVRNFLNKPKTTTQEASKFPEKPAVTAEMPTKKKNTMAIPWHYH
jgi:hypothetical protein